MEKKKKEKSKLRKIIEGILLGIFVALIGVSCFAMISSSISKKKSGNEYAPTAIGESYMPLIVLTDSMEPDIMTNSAIFIKKIEAEDVANGFNNPDNNETYDLCFDDTFGYNSNLETLYTEGTKAFLASYSVDGVARPKTNRTTEENPAAIRTLTHRLFYVQTNTEVEYGQGRYFFFVEGINVESKNYAGANQYQVFTENELYGRVVKSSAFIGAIFSFVRSPLGLIILLLIPTLYMVITSVLELFKAYGPEESNPEEKPVGLEGLSEKDIKRLKEEMLNQIVNKDKEEEK